MAITAVRVRVPLQVPHREVESPPTQLPNFFISMNAVINNKYASYDKFIESIPEIFETTGTEIYHKRNIVKILRHNGIDFVVKRYKQPNPVQRVAYTFFCPGKAERAYRYAERMLAMGISTPLPVAYIEIKKSGLLIDSYFVSELTTDKSLFPELVEKTAYDKELALDVARFMVMLHENGVLHGDPNLSNILYHTDADGTNHFTLIDTNRTRFGARFTQNDCTANLMRLTHRREVLSLMTSEYARQRNWDIDKTVDEVLTRLTHFEKRRETRHRFKKLLSPFKRK